MCLPKLRVSVNLRLARPLTPLINADELNGFALHTLRQVGGQWQTFITGFFKKKHTIKEMSVEISAATLSCRVSLASTAALKHTYTCQGSTQGCYCVQKATACFLQLTLKKNQTESILFSPLLVCYDSLDKNRRKKKKKNPAHSKGTLTGIPLPSVESWYHKHTHTHSKGHKKSQNFCHYASFKVNDTVKERFQMYQPVKR